MVDEMKLSIYDRGRTCSYCKCKIPKEEKHIRFQHSVNMRGSLTINICVVCLKNALSEIKDEEYDEIEKRHKREETLNILEKENDRN